MRYAIFALALLVASATAYGQSKPNILFIVVDDLGYTDQSYGWGELIGELNSVARLQKYGNTFNNARANSPLCSASRANMLTGRVSARHGIIGAQGHLKEARYEETREKTSPFWDPRLDVIPATRLRTSFVTLPEICKQAGYRTGHFGKGHVDREGLMLAHGCDVDYPGISSAGPPGGTYFDAEGRHIDNKVATECINFMNGARAARVPFYAQLWFYSVHTPFEATPDRIAYWKARYAELRLPYSPTYAAMLERFDNILNRVIDELEAKKAFKDTIVVFTSDNGTSQVPEGPGRGPVTETGIRGGKGMIWDGGTYVPLVICDPTLPYKGSWISDFATHVDIMPTLQDLASLPATGQPQDGISLLPYMYGARRPTPAFVYFPQHGSKDPVDQSRHAPAAAVYLTRFEPATPEIPSGSWKLVKFYNDGPNQGHRYELYRIESDWAETIDQADRYPLFVSYLADQLRRFEQRTGALVPVKNPDYGSL